MMTNERLEFYLNRKNTVFGYNTIDNDNIVGWIILSKQFPDAGFFERFTEADDPKAYRAQMKIENEPYVVWIAEMHRAAFEADKYPGPEDYLLNLSYTFSALDDVAAFLKTMRYELSEIKWGADVNFL